MNLFELEDQIQLFRRSAASIWTEPWIARNLLKAHLDETSDAASRKPATIDKIVDWIARFIPPGARVLDLGCGPGLYAERLTRRGFRVTGIDQNAASIEYARSSAESAGLTIDYRLGNYLESDLGGPYDAAICVYCDVGALTDAERDRLLSRTRSALVPEGVFIFDVFGPALEARHVVGKSWRAGKGSDFWSEGPYLLLEERVRYTEARALGTRYVLLEAEDRSTDTSAKPDAKEFILWDRYYEEAELRDVLAERGFTVIEVIRDLVAKNEFTSDDVLFSASRRT